MNKKLFCLVFALLLVALLAVSAVAAEAKTVYVKDGANGSGATAEDAVGSLPKALDLLGQEGGTVVLLSPVSVSGDLTIYEQRGDLTITAEGSGRLVFAGDMLTFAKNKNANVFTVDAPIATGENGLTIYGGFNSIHFTNKFAVDGIVNFFGGVDAPKLPSNTYNGYLAEKTEINEYANTELPYRITVDGGNFGLFSGGNHRNGPSNVIGSIAAELTVVINGGTFTNEVSHDANTALKIDHAFSLSGMSFLADNASLTVNGGVFNTPIYAQGYIDETTTTSSAASVVTKSDPKYYAADGDITITLNGGTFNGCEISAEQTAASYNRLLRGNFNVTVGADAEIADGLVIDATQVKAYAGSDAKATLTAEQPVNYKRFDIVNGNAAEPYEEPIRIACVGDSITQGSCAYVNGVVNYEEYAYPAQLYAKAVAAGKDVIISNYGCGATKVMDYSGLWYNAGLAYTLSMEETDADWFVVGLGTNDAVTASNSFGQAKTFEQQYTEFITGYAELPTTKMVYGTSALYRYRSDIAAVSTIRALQEKVLKSLAEDGKKTTYIDLYALTLEEAVTGKLLYTDALHPDAEGYTIYADAIFDALYNGILEVEDFEMEDIYVSATGKRNGKGTREDPVKELSVAFAKAAPEATIHFLGDYAVNKLTLRDSAGETTNQQYYAFNTPHSVKKLTFVGEGETPVRFSVESKYFFCNSDVKFDNICLLYDDLLKDTTASLGGNALYIALGYHNAEFTDTFTTPGSGYAILATGYMVFNDSYAAGRFDSPESMSSDADAIVDVKNGDFIYIVAGNLHWDGYKTCTYGTYSGDTVLTIGPKVKMQTSVANINGVAGMNYLTGSITANIGAWHENKPIRDYTKIAFDSKYAATYAESQNTGTVTVNLTDGLERDLLVTGDFTDDGKVDLADALLLVDYYMNGMDSAKTANFYDRTEVQLIHVLRALKALAK